MERLRRISLATLVLAVLVAAPAAAQSPQQFDPDATRYMALGDSIAAGYKAMPVTDGYAYRLYTNGAFDRIPHTLFCNAAVPGATSDHVLLYQVPQAVKTGFNPKYITLTVGGNDLLSIVAYVAGGGDPTDGFAAKVLQDYGTNLAGILAGLRAGLPNAKIFVGNQYPLDEINRQIPFTDDVIHLFNQVVAQVAAGVDQGAGKIFVVDVYSAFEGKNNLVEGERGNTDPGEVHPTNAGHRVMEKAFADVIALHK